MKNEITVSASKIKRKKKFVKIVKLSLLIIILLLLISYVVMGLIYNGSTFSISLDKNLYLDKNVIIYDDSDYKVFRSELFAPTVDMFDNMSGTWLPKDIDSSTGGSHNGDNYVAYTFFIENMGEVSVDYWSEVIIDDVIQNVDAAIRVRVYKNGEETTYAKTSIYGTPEKGTVAFESETLIAQDHVEGFEPGDKNKYTVVIWLEGNDVDCTDNILGGEIKLHMAFNSEFVED